MSGSDGELTELRRRLMETEERCLNAVDAVHGAMAQAAQAKRDAEEYFHRLDIRERELRRLKEFLGFELETPLDDVLSTLEQRPRAR